MPSPSVSPGRGWTCCRSCRWSRGRRHRRCPVASSPAAARCRSRTCRRAAPTPAAGSSVTMRNWYSSPMVRWPGSTSTATVVPGRLVGDRAVEPGPGWTRRHVVQHHAVARVVEQGEQRAALTRRSRVKRHRVGGMAARAVVGEGRARPRGRRRVEHARRASARTSVRMKPSPSPPAPSVATCVVGDHRAGEPSRRTAGRRRRRGCRPAAVGGREVTRHLRGVVVGGDGGRCRSGADADGDRRGYCRDGPGGPCGPGPVVHVSAPRDSCWCR